MTKELSVLNEFKRRLDNSKGTLGGNMTKKLTNAQKKRMALKMQQTLIDDMKDKDIGCGETKGKPINLSTIFAPIIKENRARLRDIKKNKAKESIMDYNAQIVTEGILGKDKKLISLFEKAEKLVYGARQLEYGDFKAGYAQALELYRTWNFGSMELRSVSDLMMLMVFIKMARNRNATKEDNIVDAIGYLEMHFRSLPSQIGNEK